MDERDSQGKEKDCPNQMQLWQVCVESADRVSQRRDSSNGFFTTLCTALLASAAAMGNKGSSVLLLSGVAICLVWLLHIKSFRKLNEAKFKVINSLEEEMPIKPFTAEWNFLVNGGKYVKQTHIERILPIVFIAIYIYLLFGKACH